MKFNLFITIFICILCLFIGCQKEKLDLQGTINIINNSDALYYVEIVDKNGEALGNKKTVNRKDSELFILHEGTYTFVFTNTENSLANYSESVTVIQRKKEDYVIDENGTIGKLSVTNNAKSMYYVEVNDINGVQLFERQNISVNETKEYYLPEGRYSFEFTNSESSYLNYSEQIDIIEYKTSYISIIDGVILEIANKLNDQYFVSITDSEGTIIYNKEKFDAYDKKTFNLLVGNYSLSFENIEHPEWSYNDELVIIDNKVTVEYDIVTEKGNLKILNNSAYDLNLTVNDDISSTANIVSGASETITLLGEHSHRIVLQNASYPHAYIEKSFNISAATETVFAVEDCPVELFGKNIAYYTTISIPNTGNGSSSGRPTIITVTNPAHYDIRIEDLNGNIPTIVETIDHEQTLNISLFEGRYRFSFLFQGKENHDYNFVRDITIDQAWIDNGGAYMSLDVNKTDGNDSNFCNWKYRNHK